MAENWGALSVGLPEDILKKKWAGDFKGALELIEARLADPRAPLSLKEGLKMEKIILERLPREYPIPRAQAIEKVRERIPDFTEEEFDRLELENKLDYIYVLGEKMYFRRFVNTLLKVNPDLAARAGIAPNKWPNQLDEVIARMKKKGEITCHVRMKHTVYIEDDAFVPGETYTVHIPIPMPAAQIHNIRLLTEDKDMIVAPENQAQRTVCFKEKLTENKRFSVEYEYDNVCRYVDPMGEGRYRLSERRSHQALRHGGAAAAHRLYAVYACAGEGAGRRRNGSRAHRPPLL